MSDCIDNDLEFHGTKKGGTRKTAVKAFQPRARMISAIKLVVHEAKLLNDRNYMNKATYHHLLDCMGVMAEFYRKDKRLPLQKFP